MLNLIFIYVIDCDLVYIKLVFFSYFVTFIYLPIVNYVRIYEILIWKNIKKWEKNDKKDKQFMRDWISFQETRCMISMWKLREKRDFSAIRNY